MEAIHKDKIQAAFRHLSDAAQILKVAYAIGDRELITEARFAYLSVRTKSFAQIRLIKLQSAAEEQARKAIARAAM